MGPRMAWTMQMSLARYSGESRVGMEVWGLGRKDSASDGQKASFKTARGAVMAHLSINRHTGERKSQLEKWPPSDWPVSFFVNCHRRPSLTEGSAIPEHVGLDCKRKVVDLGRGSKPTSGTLLLSVPHVLQVPA